MSALDIKALRQSDIIQMSQRAALLKVIAMLGDPIRWINTTGFAYDNPSPQLVIDAAAGPAIDIPPLRAEGQIVTSPRLFFLTPMRRVASREAVLAHRRGERYQWPATA